MESKEVKLLGFWVSPFSRRVEWALKVKGVGYEYIEEDIFNKSNLLLELNPVHKKVPVLVHDGKVIAESFILLEYVDETWKHHPLLPQDPHQRALARFWAKFCEEKVFETAWNALCSKGEEKQKALEQCKEAMEKMEEEVFKGKQILGSDGRSNLGYLDIAVGWISHWLPVFEEVGSMQILDPLQFPATAAWIDRFLNHPLIKDNLPPREKMLVYFHQRSQELSSTAQGWIKV
ncbi:hypothetical protein SLEP1_g29358 [Rubroshorea leprosula]|uniref:Glutathione S-transferase n=1 Tax=Rubroshorea leprosula TaxID=152421 RepID=A0AAV5JWP0_9ROSI|nr:hypothetical protein SLEP1_g29358 [Rubroshorea leprosula]